MSRPIQAIISLRSIRHNIDVIKSKIGTTKFFSVIKADAYGHGIDNIYPAISDSDGIAVLDLEDAIKLRENGWCKDILLLEGFFDSSDLELIDRYNLCIVIHGQWQLKAISSFIFKNQINIYLKLNSGMNRLGFKNEEVKSIINILKSIKNIKSIIMMSHFFNSSDTQSIKKQMDIIDDFLEFPLCLANSGAILWSPETHFHWVRAGAILYGISPRGKPGDIADYNLLPAMTLESKVIATHNIKSGESIGYSGKFIAKSPMKIAIVACGYGDGYPRLAPSGTPVLIEGNRCPLVGMVSMDMLCVDISHVTTIDVGSKVELWGTELLVDEVAGFSGTIGYDLTCSVTKRVPKKIIY
ncbi:alanine racemase [Morganella morganii]|uniref:Alanine racemase n=1 Tax=Morganella morganii TaxID=582 RepID=A0A8I0U633_MORMO|nr:alanine racemase [Morganella morganii]MBE8614725.1 alanine racemase [Morganella morganii]